MTTDRAEPQQPSLRSVAEIVQHMHEACVANMTDLHASEDEKRVWSDHLEMCKELTIALASPAPDPAQEAAPVDPEAASAGDAADSLDAVVAEMEADSRVSVHAWAARLKGIHRGKLVAFDVKYGNGFNELQWANAEGSRDDYTEMDDRWGTPKTIIPLYAERAPPAAPVANGTEGQHRERERLRAIQHHCDNVFGLRAIECESGFRVEYDNVKCRTILKAEIFSMVESINKRACPGCEGSGLQEEDACTFCWGQGTTTELAPTNTPASAAAEPHGEPMSDGQIAYERAFPDKTNRVPFKLLPDWMEHQWHRQAEREKDAPPPIARNAADELSTLRQAVWDALGHLGFDRDGDPTPAALTYPPLSKLIVDVAKEFRAEYDECLRSDAAPAGSQQSGSGEATVSDAMFHAAARRAAGLGYNANCDRAIGADDLRLILRAALAAQNPPAASGAADDARDAERYRFLRSQDCESDFSVMHAFDGDSDWPTLADLDERIDKALAASSDTPARSK